MQKLRVAIVETMLSLGELVRLSCRTLDEVLNITRPTGVLADDTVNSYLAWRRSASHHPRRSGYE
jgi:hypothetical protein